MSEVLRQEWFATWFGGRSCVSSAYKYPSVRLGGMELAYIHRERYTGTHPQRVYLYTGMYGYVHTHTCKGIYQEIVKGRLTKSNVHPLKNC